jgi:dihydroorotate dehydrogenase
MDAGVRGLQLDGSIASEAGKRLVGLPAREPALQQVRCLRECWPGTFIIGSGGIHEPADALAMRAAGADLDSSR